MPKFKTFSRRFARLTQIKNLEEQNQKLEYELDQKQGDLEAQTEKCEELLIANDSKDGEISRLADTINRLEENVQSFDRRKSGFKTCSTTTPEEQTSKTNSRL